MTEPLEETVERYLQRRQPTWRPVTVVDKRYDLLAVCRYLRAHHPELQQWSELQRDPHILGWLRHHLHLKPATRIIRILHLRLFFEDLIVWGWPQAPVPGLIHDEDIPPQPLVLPKPLPPDVDRAVQEAPAGTPTLAARGLLLIRYTGLRLGELRELSVHALERTGADTCSLRVPVGKTHSERIIPLRPEAVVLVEDILAACPRGEAKKCSEQEVAEEKIAECRRVSIGNSLRDSSPRIGASIHEAESGSPFLFMLLVHLGGHASYSCYSLGDPRLLPSPKASVGKQETQEHG